MDFYTLEKTEQFSFKMLHKYFVFPQHSLFKHPITVRAVCFFTTCQLHGSQCSIAPFHSIQIEPEALGHRRECVTEPVTSTPDLKCSAEYGCNDIASPREVVPKL